ncbi:MAG: ORF6N domain-containing protein [Bacteroidetes bacterium]|nr:ORF6N domain-containing protein [Bacteroidota bacterium]MBS1941471.1 ORF6N domain-containing protein [Bacteroidota bacterium]
MKILVPTDHIERLIYEFRGVKVMLDSDLAKLYEVETKHLKRQVKRNIDRFPEDFMFVLDNEEFGILRHQFGTSSWGGSRYAPMAFTEQGIAQLSSVLSSTRAIAVNIQIIRLFTRMRTMLITHKDLLLQVEKLRSTVGHNSRDIKVVFNILKRMQEEERNRSLLAQVTKKRPPIGYKKAKD